MHPKQKIIAVLGSGGHTTQMIKLTETLYDVYDFEYIVNDDDDRSIKAAKFPGDVYSITRPRRVYDGSIIRSIALTMYSLSEAYSIIKNSESVAIVSAGPGLSIPLFIWAKIFKKKRIFLESWSRVTTKSTTGKICYYLSDVFFIQWPELIELYPRAIYVGRLG